MSEYDQLLESLESYVNVGAAAAIRTLLADRDGLMASRIAYASEFPANEDGEPDVGSIHENIRKLKFERDEAMALLREMDRTLSLSAGNQDYPSDLRVRVDRALAALAGGKE